MTNLASRHGRLIVLAALASTLSSSLQGQQAIVSGTVFADANGNGVRDPGERGIKGVAVSNQEVVVLSDSAGAFALPPGKSGVVFVSVPDGYTSQGLFWRAPAAGARDVNFALKPAPKPASFTFIHASDTHLSQQSLDRTRRFRAMADSIKPAFSIITGDLVRDAMSATEASATGEFQLIHDELQRLAQPVWVAPGNHDHFGIIRSRSHVDPSHPLYGRGMYHKFFGPDYYSFNYGGIHFVALNTLAADDSAYYGYVDSLQLAWLSRDLATVPATTPVVTFNHIPLVSAFDNLAGYIDMALVGSVATGSGKKTFRHTTGNVLDVLNAVKGHPYPLALGGHNHAASRIAFETRGMMVRFEQTAAIIGGGDLGVMTIPSGFTVYHVKNGKIDAGQFVPLDRQ